MNEYVTDILLENAKSTLDEKLISLRDEYRTNGVPTLLTESLNELILFVKLKKPKRILELGTATGCSGIAMLLASPCSTLTTIEKFEKSAEEAKTKSRTGSSRFSRAANTISFFWIVINRNIKIYCR